MMGACGWSRHGQARGGDMPGLMGLAGLAGLVGTWRRSRFVGLLGLGWRVVVHHHDIVVHHPSSTTMIEGTTQTFGVGERERH